MELESRIRNKIDDLKRLQQEYLVEANKQLAMYDAAIGVLEQLLLPEQSVVDGTETNIGEKSY